MHQFGYRTAVPKTDANFRKRKDYPLLCCFRSHKPEIQRVVKSFMISVEVRNLKASEAPGLCPHPFIFMHNRVTAIQLLDPYKAWKPSKLLSFSCIWGEPFGKTLLPASVRLSGVLEEHKIFLGLIFTLTSANFYLFFLHNFTNALSVYVYLSITIYKTITLIDPALTSNSLRPRLFLSIAVPVEALIPYSAYISVTITTQPFCKKPLCK